MYILRRVWDAPTRLFHWTIVLLVFTSWLTQHENWMQLHLLSGYTMAALLLFRLAWGFIGSDTARFGRFVKSPVAAFRHLAHVRRRAPDTEIGHNAAGGWMVLVMLGLLAVQVVTGLCANDQVATEGPLAHVVGPDRSDWLSHIHTVTFTLIEAAIALHLLAILTYALLGYRLVPPMITGKKRLPEDIPPPRIAGSWRAAGVFAVAALLVASLVVWLTP